MFASVPFCLLLFSPQHKLCAHVIQSKWLPFQWCATNSMWETRTGFNCCFSFVLVFKFINKSLGQILRNHSCNGIESLIWHQLQVYLSHSLTRHSVNIFHFCLIYCLTVDLHPHAMGDSASLKKNSMLCMVWAMQTSLQSSHQKCSSSEGNIADVLKLGGWKLWVMGDIYSTPDLSKCLLFFCFFALLILLMHY